MRRLSLFPGAFHARFVIHEVAVQCVSLSALQLLPVSVFVRAKSGNLQTTIFSGRGAAFKHKRTLIILSLYFLRPILDDRLGKHKECQRYNYKIKIKDESNRKSTGIYQIEQIRVTVIYS